MARLFRHPEHSEGSLLQNVRFFAPLRMTTRCAIVIGPERQMDKQEIIAELRRVAELLGTPHPPDLQASGIPAPQEGPVWRTVG